jgi:hypothetical protein
MKPKSAHTSAGDAPSPRAAEHSASATKEPAITTLGEFTRWAKYPPSGRERRIVQVAMLTVAPAVETGIPRDARKLGPKTSRRIKPTL